MVRLKANPVCVSRALHYKNKFRVTHLTAEKYKICFLFQNICNSVLLCTEVIQLQPERYMYAENTIVHN